MIKVPSTPAGLPAIEQLIAEGSYVNVTLMFSNNHYTTWQTPTLGESKARQSGTLADMVFSVASFFVSRVETLVDKSSTQKPNSKRCEPPHSRAQPPLRTKAGLPALHRAFSLATASRTHERRAKQRPLWASTGTKDKAYSDVKYIEELIGPDTVNTMPPATMDAYRDHGDPRTSPQ